MPETLDRIASVRAALPAEVPVQVDGGTTSGTSPTFGTRVPS
jgi:pentose-5-phosphate-3-epimerase